VSQLQGLVTQMSAGHRSQQERLLAGQARFHDEAQRAYTGLAESVDRSLKTSLVESARLAGATIEPAVQATMAGLARETAALHETLGGSRCSAAGRHALQPGRQHRPRCCAGCSAARSAKPAPARAQKPARGLERPSAEGFRRALTEHLHQALLATVALRTARRRTGAQRGTGSRRHAAGAGTHASPEPEAPARTPARALADGRQQQICSTLEQTAQAITAQAEAHARATIGEITRLVQAASAAPRAAAEVIGELRRALSESLVRDNAVLDERKRLLGTLGGLLDAVNHASTEQRSAIDALVQATTARAGPRGQRFARAWRRVARCRRWPRRSPAAPRSGQPG
jgi:hypothetical protein